MVNLPQASSTGPQPGRNADSAGAQSQACSTSSQASRFSSSQAGSTLPEAVRVSYPLAGISNTPMSSRNSPQRGENTQEDPKFKWVINLSSKPLTQAQRSLLAKGPYYMVSPRHPPNLEYVTAIESVCTKLGQEEVE